MIVAGGYLGKSRLFLTFADLHPRKTKKPTTARRSEIPSGMLWVVVASVCVDLPV